MFMLINRGGGDAPSPGPCRGPYVENTDLMEIVQGCDNSLARRDLGDKIIHLRREYL